MESHIKTRIVSAIIKDAEKGKIDFSHPLQRQEGQWTRYTQSLEMDSLVRGWPINFIFIWKNDNKNYVLEGKQRITSLLSFKQDKYALIIPGN